jgi:hypothetical protein
MLEEDKRNRLINLDEIAKKEISNVFYGVGEIGSAICSICDNINIAIDVFLVPQSGADLNDAACLNFLKSSLPVLIEIFLRRTTLRCVALGLRLGLRF